MNCGSDIGICNLALGILGADLIRSFGEKNKRSRMCEVFYYYVRDYLLAKFDWPFARAYKVLQKLDLPIEDLPLGLSGYELPADCMTPRDISPKGSATKWEIMGNVLYTNITPVGLYYTRTAVDATAFSTTFANLLATGLAVRLCGPITQDKEMAKTLYARFKQEELDAHESDANIGNDYRSFDENPENDSFITGTPLGVPLSQLVLEPERRA
jgi:hypothetical protein